MDWMTRQCTFVVLIDRHHLGGDPARIELTHIVHAAHIDPAHISHPLAAGPLALGGGGLDVETDDHRPLERDSFVHDALYASCQRQTKRPS